MAALRRTAFEQPQADGSRLRRAAARVDWGRRRPSRWPRWAGPGETVLPQTPMIMIGRSSYTGVCVSLHGSSPRPRSVAVGRVAKAAAVNRAMLRRPWAAGAAPDGDRLTIDPDATRVATYPGKEGSAFSRTRGGAANVGRAMGAFIDEYRPRSRMAAAAGTGCGSGSTRPAISSR